MRLRYSPPPWQVRKGSAWRRTQGMQTKEDRCAGGSHQPPAGSGSSVPPGRPVQRLRQGKRDQVGQKGSSTRTRRTTSQQVGLRGTHLWGHRTFPAAGSSESNVLPSRLNFRNRFTLSSCTTWNVRAELFPTRSNPLSPVLEMLPRAVEKGNNLAGQQNRLSKGKSTVSLVEGGECPELLSQGGE